MGGLEGEVSGSGSGGRGAIFCDEVPAVVEEALVVGEGPGGAVGGGGDGLRDAPALGIIREIELLAGNAGGGGSS